MSTDISLTELEKAINDWRSSKPSTGEERTLSAEVNALASVYALMIYQRKATLAIGSVAPFPRQLLEDWIARQAVVPSQENT